MKNLLRKLLKPDNKGRLFMEIADKVGTEKILKDGKERYCPPHHLPHVLPWKPPVTDEQCHIHTSGIKHYGHHAPFCKLLRCPNYKAMKEAKQIYGV